jgi:hypothetical protein
MFLPTVALLLQTTSPFFLIDQIDGDAAPTPGGKLIYTIDAKVVGRKGKVLMDTKVRGLTFKLQQRDPAQTLFEYAINGLGRKGKRVVADPESGTVAWVTVVNIKRI